MINNKGFVTKRGLYDPLFEHDACGIGFVVNISGEKQHSIISQALCVLNNMAHRGGEAGEKNTGDGAGILVQIPHEFFKKILKNGDINLPKNNEYGVGMVFLPQDKEKRLLCEKIIEKCVKDENLNVLGWRTLPVNSKPLGQSAQANMPYIKQIFIAKASQTQSFEEFERKLFVARKICEKYTSELSENDEGYFYIASLSSKTIVYKGMLTPKQVDMVYIDLQDQDFKSALALVHSRYSTNTFPSWERAHPCRYLIHNGEINTLRGNVNKMTARESVLKSDAFGSDLKKIFPIINRNGSDSAMFDNTLEFLHLSGRSLPHAVMMMIPQAFEKNIQMSKETKNFYEFSSINMEPWDGPAALAFTDGEIVGATLDRNGLRPSRYCITKSGKVILASETGALDIDPKDILKKERLSPGKMLVIDTSQKRIVSEEELSQLIHSQKPYGQWLSENLVHMSKLEKKVSTPKSKVKDILQAHRVFDYSYEDLKSIILPMAKDGSEPIGSMGIDTPIAVLSKKPQSLFNYFKQLFAQVTNPPIDAIREEMVTGTTIYLGAKGNLLEEKRQDSTQIKIDYPILTNRQLAAIENIQSNKFTCQRIDILFDKTSEGRLEKGLDIIFDKCDKAILSGANILILSDKNFDEVNVPIPSLLALSAVCQHLIKTKQRTKVAVIIESGQARQVHHMATLLGYGACAINPYLAYESIGKLFEDNLLSESEIKLDKAIDNYTKSLVKGIVKIISKMGISTIQSYQGAQIFEALGVDEKLIEKYFTGTTSRIGGIGIESIEDVAIENHSKGFDENNTDTQLESSGTLRWRKDGEYHKFNPVSVHKLQRAVRDNNYELFKEYSILQNKESGEISTIRGLLEFKNINESIPIEEVEPVESIVKRFKTGAMSYGSISKEAHEALAIAMNRLGGKSNTGEGGEDIDRFVIDENNDSRCSAIKQVASGRFGVTSYYLSNAKEIQIKMAQGAKPGEGGQLPAEKVYPWIAKTRHSTPGVGLISPPPHHDIYSIEDLAQLIFDLKNANKNARISVKLVSEVGVGTVAAGVAKGKADVVLISGFDGGTGAAPLTSIEHAGLPWELGLAETHQTLLLNNLRDKIVIETDGKLMTGRDVVIAALLGAQEFGFATAPLIALGCVMMRVCNLDTCPVGVATQNPKLREKFCGKPEYVENFMKFIAMEMREIMSQLGVKTVDDLVGRCELLEQRKDYELTNKGNIDLSKILYQEPLKLKYHPSKNVNQAHKLKDTLDGRVLIPFFSHAIKKNEPSSLSLKIDNTNRAVGTMLGNYVTNIYKENGLAEDTVKINFNGSAGQSFGAFIPSGITLSLTGESNDYTGKGLSGGKIIVKTDPESKLIANENTIIGNVSLYGATSGQAYINGIAGERFCVRNSGAKAVVEGVGDHGCEYMTGGMVVVLGDVGRNFAAGMSGGVAYILDEKKSFSKMCNIEMVNLYDVRDENDFSEIKEMVTKHFEYTKSEVAKRILDNFDTLKGCFIKVMPKDYERVLKSKINISCEGKGA